MVRKLVCCLLAVAMIACGCGTVIPGPRYKVTVDDFAFTSDGSGVVYREASSRFYLLLRRYREYKDIYLYDRESRRHRFIARADAFSVSHVGPHILYSPPWDRRFKKRESEPDFYILNYKTGDRRAYRMPDDFDRSYLSYGFSYVDWKSDGSLTAFVSFRYAPGAEPHCWRKQMEKPADWRTRLWRVTLTPEDDSELQVRAEPCNPDEIPTVTWKEIHRKKYVSPDGASELSFSKYGDYLSFNSELAIVDRDTGENQKIVKESLLIGIAQAAKYTVYSVIFAPLNLLDHML